MKEIFEEWVVKQFGEKVKSMLVLYDEKSGYEDENLNSMWIGFNAGYVLAN